MPGMGAAAACTDVSGIRLLRCLMRTDSLGFPPAQSDSDREQRAILALDSSDTEA
jgi:hypothetical protein